MIQSNFINMFLDIVDQQSTLKQYLNIQDNSSEICSLVEHQLEEYSCKRFHSSQSQHKLNDELYEMQHPEKFNEKKLQKNLKIFQKQNVIKNILKSFLRYLNKLTDTIIKQKYESMYNKYNLISYSEIKKSLSRKVNDKTTRWNFKLNSVLQSHHIQPIFHDYLKNASKNWLQKSKVSNLIEHETLIDGLIKQIEIEKPLKIRIYKKKR
ncbi:hypothetical protein ABPG72_005295 [Tetrahymena utriculariae]